MEEKEIFIPENVMVEEDLFEPELEGAEEVVEEGVEVSVPEETVAEKTVPLAALQQERSEKKALRNEVNKLKDIVSRLYESTGASTPEELMGKMDDIELAQVMRNRNIDEGTARYMMDMQRENRKYKREGDKRNFDTEINALAQNPMYDDILELKDEVEEYAMQKGLSVKEAYNALYGEARAAKMSEAAKRQAVEQQKIKDSKKIQGLSQRGNGAATENEVNLTASELAVARAAGLTPKEYAQYKKKE